MHAFDSNVTGLDGGDQRQIWVHPHRQLATMNVETVNGDAV